MNKRELVAAAARRTPLTQRQVCQALESVLEVIGQALAAGDSVTIAGFGRFQAQRYAGRYLRHFGGEGHYQVGERVVPVFRSSAALRRKVREGEE
jgi:DNA-binding protein HU-beta